MNIIKLRIDIDINMPILTLEQIINKTYALTKKKVLVNRVQLKLELELHEFRHTITHYMMNFIGCRVHRPVYGKWTGYQTQRHPLLK